MKKLIIVVSLLAFCSLDAVAEEREKDFGPYPSIGLTLGVHTPDEYGNPGTVLAMHVTALKFYNARIGGMGISIWDVSLDPVKNDDVKIVPLIHIATVILYESESNLDIAGSVMFALGENGGPVIGLTLTF